VAHAGQARPGAWRVAASRALRSSSLRRRLDYVNHARRLAEDDWGGLESEGEEEEGGEEEEMDVDAGRKLPKRYANQVRGARRRGRRILPGLALPEGPCLGSDPETRCGQVEKVGCLRNRGGFGSAGSVCVPLCSALLRFLSLHVFGTLGWKGNLTGAGFQLCWQRLCPVV